MRNIPILSLALLGTPSLSETLNGTRIAHDLGSILSPKSSIYLPSDLHWANETTQRFNSWDAPTYVVSVKPGLTEDAQKVVRYASHNNVSFLSTGKGHGYTGSLVTLQHGIELDLGGFNTVSVDAKKNLLTIGGSVSFTDMMDQVYSAGKAMPVGGCSCVGVAGASLGGGIGFYSGFYGAISDSLVSVEIVLANGSLVTASKSENSDLFWAIKGAGANFGVVTSLTYQIYDSPNAGQVMNADMTFPVDKNGTLWEFAQSWVGRQPKELSISFSTDFNATTQQLFILVNVIYAGSLSEGTPLIQPLLDLKPQNTNISYLPWKYIPDTSNYGVPGKNCELAGLSFIPYSLNLYQIDVEALTAAINFLNHSIATTPALQAFLVSFTQFSPYGFQLYAESSSSFPFRDVVSYVQIEGIAFDPEVLPTIDAFGRSFRDLLQKSSWKDQLEVYTNFAHGDEGVAAWYTEANVPMLTELKQRFDPNGLFSFYNPV
ncbi:FAD-linked oxidoreductase [Lachnellula willkommii]|uniref:FAD-linked oxidoreductase n=1 Tax=Lachnellula willkommii TaxID=215461 RepID=A0A559MMI6_9HELO|nr:FAD-linked oxidoreductase [Lachnellula willkommii]